MKRFGIFLFYDKDGIVDDYVSFYLEQFKPFFEETCIVVNGFVDDASKKKLEKYSDKLIIRENKGYDAWAYKTVLEDYGYDYFKKFDELIIHDYTFFGPFYPLDEMFSTMDKKECDWWGHIKWPLCTEGKFYKYISSSFSAFRSSILNSDAFKNYWESLPEINSYLDSHFLHERRQTHYFDDLGFKSESYIADYEEFKPYWSQNYPIVCADKLISKYRYPFMKRRMFFITNKALDLPTKKCNERCIEAIRKTNYDLKLVEENLKRTQDVNSLPKIIKNIKYHKYKLLANIGFWDIAHYKEKFQSIDTQLITKGDYLRYFK